MSLFVCSVFPSVIDCGRVYRHQGTNTQRFTQRNFILGESLGFIRFTPNLVHL